MSMQLNIAAIEYLERTEAIVKAELVKRFEAAGRDPAEIEIWTNEMIASTCEDDVSYLTKRIGRNKPVAVESSQSLTGS